MSPAPAPQISPTDLSDLQIPAELLAVIPAREVFRRFLLPIGRRRGTLQVATSAPLSDETTDELRCLTGLDIEPVLARRDELDRLIKRHLGLAGGTVGEMLSQQSDGVEFVAATDDAADDDESAMQASVVRLVNELLVDAVNQRASDIHLEPEEDGLVIRQRIDGLLRVEPTHPDLHRFRAAIVSRLKIMARLNIAEKRLPQDGRIKLRVAGREIDVRVSIIPMLHGEGVVLRLLDKSRTSFDLSGLDLPAEIESAFRKLIGRPHGMFLVTGPTGSGKTTTLYSVLAGIRRASTKIVTIEDPVEYHLPGVSQIPIHARIGLTFAAGLRSILRHDPDVILVGEIRDGETAESAIQASLTGHLVLSTLHTNDAPSAFTRLVDMGIEPYLVASTLDGVLAQRLVRKLCPHCRIAESTDSAALPDDLPKPAGPTTIFRAGGCRECHGTGYAGRTALFELLPTDAAVRDLCVRRASAAEIRAHALRRGMTTLRQAGWARVLQGVTSVEEILRVCSTEGE